MNYMGSNLFYILIFYFLFFTRHITYKYFFIGELYNRTRTDI